MGNVLRSGAGRLPVAAALVLTAARWASGADPSTRAAEPADAGPTITKWVDQLSAPDPDARDVAADQLGHLPYAQLPLLEAAAARSDLPPEGTERLRHLMPAARQRAKLAARAHAVEVSRAGFYEPTARAEYDAGNHTDPKWDGPARELLRLATHRYADLDNPAAAAADKAAAVEQLKRATDAGCDDPAVLAFGGLVTIDTAGADAAQPLFARGAAAAADDGGRAGPLSKLILDNHMLLPAAHLDAADRRRQKPDLVRRLNDGSRQFKRLLADPALPPSVAAALARVLYDRNREVATHLQGFVDRVLEPLGQAMPNDPAVLTLKGQAYIDWAWEARGSDWANQVTPQGWHDMAARLDVARQALTRAWQLDPDDPGPPTEMLVVELGQDNGRPAMEAWFDRAMAANPDDVTACTRKLYYLEPKWHGDAAAMLQFGHECVDRGDWRTAIPMVLVDAHVGLAAYESDRAAYWRQPGVWDDVRQVYAGYLKRFPTSVTFHSGLAAYAVKCHQWAAADEQFKWLGDRADPKPFGGPAALAKARRRAADRADKPDPPAK